MSTERIHHPTSPSSLQNREACPKYKNRNSTNAAALIGTIQHEATERGEDDARLSDRQVEAVVQCRQFVDERAALYPGCTRVQEIYLPIDDDVIVVDTTIVTPFDIVGEDGQISPGFRGVQKREVFDGTTAGFLDYAIISSDLTEAEIIDYKFGKNAVTEAKDNLQGIAYMLGLKKLYPTLVRCRVTFIQPHIDEISEHTFDLRNTDELYLRIRTVVGRAVEAAKNPNDFSTARPNVGTCVFCAHVGRCPAVQNLVLKLGQKYKPLEIPDTVNPSSMFDPKDVDSGLRLADVAKAWAEAFRRQATEKTLENMDFVPEGYMLVMTTKRNLLDPRKFADMAKEFIAPEKHAAVEALFDITMGPVEDLIKETAPRGQKDKTVELFGAKLLEAGVIEMGTPFAFLRQASKKEKSALK